MRILILLDVHRKKNLFLIILLRAKIKRCAVLLQSFTFPMSLLKLLNHKSTEITAADDQVEQKQTLENTGTETTTEAT